MVKFEEQGCNAAWAKENGYEAFKRQVNEAADRGAIGEMVAGKQVKPTENQIKAMFTKITGIEIKKTNTE